MNKWFPLSAVVLLLSNSITIGVAVLNQWAIEDVVWVFWFQSVIIGIFQALKMIQLQHFRTDGLTLNGQSVDPTEKTKRSVVLFFLCHYGAFHGGYCLFLWMQFQHIPWASISGLIAVFFVNHLFSYISNKRNDYKQYAPNIGHMMFFPYIRIIPMHLSFFFVSASGGVGSLMVFLLLKTGADVLMHIVEHRIAASSRVVS